MKRNEKKMIESLPDDWNVLKVSEFTLNHKQGYYTKDSYVDEGIPLVRVTDLYGDRLAYEDMPMLNVSEKDLESFKVNEGDFLFARSGSIGRYGIANCDKLAIFGSYLIRFVFNQDVVTNRFFGYLYESDITNRQLKAITQGSSNININADNIKGLSVPVPSLLEQKKIAKILSAVDEHIDEVDGMITDLNELKKGLMQKLLTEGIGHTNFKESPLGQIPVDWEVYKLGNVSDFRQGFQIPRSEQITTKKDGYERYLYISDFFSNKNMLYIENSDKFYRISCKDICIANTGNTCGKSFRGAEGILSNNMFKIFPNNDLIIEEYYWHYLQSEFYWKQLRSLFNSAGQPHVGHKNMSELKIALPSVEEQRRLVKILDAIDERIGLFCMEAIDLNDTKKGLMQQLLTGKTRVKIDN